MTVQDILADTRNKMQKAVEVLQEQLKGVRTGKASTLLVENIKVEYYGSPTPLKQIATLAVPQPDTIVIKPFDPNSLRTIETAIKTSDLSIAPIVDGKFVRLNIPPLSEERRTQLVAQTKKTGEQAKISIRNIRRESNKHLEKSHKDKLITEDDLQAGKKQIDEVTHERTDDIDSIVKHKSDEIMLE
jgi:ribosome recycling factor